MRDLSGIEFKHEFARLRRVDREAIRPNREGAFVLDLTNGRFMIIASSADGWDHVSVSTDKRTPTWAEMDYVKQLFFYKHEVVMQLHVATENHINIHPYCLHMWRPVHAEIPLPPTEMV